MRMCMSTCGHGGLLPTPSNPKRDNCAEKSQQNYPTPLRNFASHSSFNPAQHTHTRTHSFDVHDAVNGEMLSAKCQAISHKSLGDK